MQIPWRILKDLGKYLRLWLIAIMVKSSATISILWIHCVHCWCQKYLHSILHFLFPSPARAMLLEAAAIKCCSFSAVSCSLYIVSIERVTARSVGSRKARSEWLLGKDSVGHLHEWALSCSDFINFSKAWTDLRIRFALFSCFPRWFWY